MGSGGLCGGPPAYIGRAFVHRIHLHMLMSRLFFLQCSHEENFEWLNKVDDGTTAVKIGNPKTLEFQVVRTSLIPGLLKTIRENRSHSLPIKIFETSDVVFKDTSRERQA